MKEPTNPFTLRSSESIDSKLTFLKFFGSGIFDALPDGCFANKVTIFRSGPGGGKTSLFRIFTPESLTGILGLGSDYNDLSQQLTRYGVIDTTGPQLLGVYLRLYGYALFQDLDLRCEEKNRYLFSLIGIRLIMKALMGILILKNLDRNQLNKIWIEKPQDHYIVGSPLPCNGKELYEWASKMEIELCGVINRFGAGCPSVDLSASIDHIYAISPDNFLIDGKPVVSKVLVLLDDLHELTKSQRRIFLDKIMHTRFPVPIWIAERLEALELDELVSEYDREYNAVYLEEYWERKTRAFETFVKSIAAKRTKLTALDFEMNSLDGHLEENIDALKRNSDFQNISSTIKNRLRSISYATRKYDSWIDKQEKLDEAPYNKAINWRLLEIEIAREENSAQTKLVDDPLEPNLEPDKRLKQVAEFFIHKEFQIPYFFGFTKISQLATFNVELFLKIAANLFDEIISMKIKDKNHDILNARRQEEIVKRLAKKYLEQIPRTNRNGKDIFKFLSAFEQFATKQTMQPNAPYLPGVTGIGISRKLYDCLTDSETQQKNQHYARLSEVLRSCISHNYLKVKYDAKQGKRGDEVVILYLNRLFCANFDLPLGKGGWRHKKLDELCEWMGLSALQGGNKN